MSSRLTEPRWVVVLAGCGHWWRESQPAGLIIPTGPRVCARCKPDAPGAVGTSPQGLAMVNVTYLTEWTEEA